MRTAYWAQHVFWDWTMLIVSSAVIPNSFFLLQKTDVVSLGMHVLSPGAGMDEKGNFLDLFFIICLNLYMSLFCLLPQIGCLAGSHNQNVSVHLWNGFLLSLKSQHDLQDWTQKPITFNTNSVHRAFPPGLLPWNCYNLQKSVQSCLCPCSARCPLGAVRLTTGMNEKIIVDILDCEQMSMHACRLWMHDTFHSPLLYPREGDSLQTSW